MEKSKLLLKNLRVKSFVTTVPSDIKETLKGGSTRETDNPADTYCELGTGPGYHYTGNRFTVSEHVP